MRRLLARHHCFVPLRTPHNPTSSFALRSPCTAVCLFSVAIFGCARRALTVAATRTVSMEVEHNAASEAGVDHYDHDGSDEDDVKQQPGAKRRRVIAANDDDGEEPSAAIAGRPRSSPAPPSPGAAPTGRKPTATSRSAQEKDKKHVHAEDTRNTPSILSFFGRPSTSARPEKAAADGATKADNFSSFFAPRSTKKAATKATVSPTKEKDGGAGGERTDHTARDEQKSGAAVMDTPADLDETKEDKPAPCAKDGGTSTATGKAAAHSPPAAKETPAPGRTSEAGKTKAASRSAPTSRAAKSGGARKKGGLMSEMKRKRMERGGGDDDDEDDAAGLQDVADKEEAAIEDEDAEASSDEDDEDHSSLARELLDMSKSAAEEKIASEDAEDANSSPSSSSASLLGSPAYHPVRSASWSAGQAVPYSALSAMFAAVEAESSRLKIIAILSDFLRSVIALTPQDLLPTVYLCINAIAPAYEGKETGVGDFILKRVIANTTGMSLQRLRESAKDVTDLGVLALSARKKQVTLFKQTPLTVRGVFGVMREMGDMSGKNVASKKEGLITKLMVSSQGEEAKFLIRSLQGSLRIGLQSKSLIAALARALVLTPPALSESTKPVLDARRALGEKKFAAALEEGIAALKQAYIEVPNLELIIGSILRYGLSELPQHCSLTPGVPVEVMLGKPASSITAILDKFSGRLFTLEYKYDGERAQIHRTKDGRIKVYSRNSEDNTGKYPDLVSRLKRYEVEGATDWIIDCEAVAWDRAERRLLPFQTLTTRKRKDVKEEDITVQVALFAFDLLYLNGRSYLQDTLRQRREALRQHFTQVEGEFSFATARDTGDVEEIAVFLNDAVQSACEGLMVKALDDGSQYTPGKRSWLKSAHPHTRSLPPLHGIPCSLCCLLLCNMRFPLAAAATGARRTTWTVWATRSTWCPSPPSTARASARATTARTCWRATTRSPRSIRASPRSARGSARRTSRVTRSSTTPRRRTAAAANSPPARATTRSGRRSSRTCGWRPCRCGRSSARTSASARYTRRPWAKWMPARASRYASRALCVSATTRSRRTRPAATRSWTCLRIKTSAPSRGRQWMTIEVQQHSPPYTQSQRECHRSVFRAPPGGHRLWHTAAAGNGQWLAAKPSLSAVIP